jgi:hypothetical protein
MRFYIEKIYLWFSREDQTCLTFENNKVNVVRGNSSRGKSNLFAIIDYCLMSDKPNIVEPIINECTEYYGIEFNLNGTYYSISRKKPKDGIGEDKVYMIEEAFSHDYYPNTTNKQVSDARKDIDRLFGLSKESYRYPWGKEKDEPLLVVSFRSFLMFNALTENIISSQYEFLNYKFFEDIYVDEKPKRDYLLDVLLGIDNVLEKQQQKILDDLNTEQRSSKVRNTKYNNAKKSYVDYLNKAIDIAVNASLVEHTTFTGQSEENKIGFLQALVERFEPNINKNIKAADDDASKLRSELSIKYLQLHNILRARKEYDSYCNEIIQIGDSLKPVEYLRSHLQEYGITIWSKKILDELQTSLSTLRENFKPAKELQFVNSTQIENLKKEIKELEDKLQQLSKIKVKPIEESIVYLAIGQLKSMIPHLDELWKSYQSSTTKEYDYAGDSEKRAKAEEILAKIQLRRSTIVSSSLNVAIQSIFDQFTQLENFQGCKTRYERKHERLELSDGKSILNYNNIGSQSNYMFLHLCFFLGLHKFLFENPNDHIGSFLFIDQPSIPYYEASDDNKSTDKIKLKDAFSVINRFIKDAVEGNHDFQIILIEHADDSYWNGDNKLEYFTTKADFDGDKALVPYTVIEKKRNETKE